jgi:hypothetical protein
MKMPSLSRLSVVTGTTLAGLLALSQEVSLSHPLHVVIALVIGGLLYLVHPAEAGVLTAKAEAETAPPYPIGAQAPAPAAPPAGAPAPPAAPAPPQQGLP